MIVACWQSVLATRPSVQASNFTVSQITCNSVQLNFAYGDGSARIIIGTEGPTPPNFVPSDDNAYNAAPYFNLKGTSAATYGTPANCFVVYNANGTNYVKIDSLKPCTTYSFTIYEHDNNGATTLYDFTSPPHVTFTTYCLSLGYTTLFKDSCERKNSYQFTSTSTSSIPGVTYTYDFGDATTASAPFNTPVTHSYTNRSGVVLVKISASPSMGCLADYFDKIRIYPRKVAFIDRVKFKDSIQCFEGNFFTVDPQPVVSPLPKSFTYTWNYGDSSTLETFKKMKHTYRKSGIFNVSVEILTNVNLQATNCKDTLTFKVQVLPNPVGSKKIGPSLIQCIKNNQFNFDNSDNTLTYFKWYFGDGDSSDVRTVSHVYKDTGTYRVIHVAYAANGCKGRDTGFIKVLPNISAGFTGLDSFYCSSNKPVKLIPDSSSGVFSGALPVSSSFTFLPNVVGSYKLKYTVGTPYCSDSIIKTYRVYATPKPALGNDVVSCATGAVVLNANYSNGTYLWNTGATSSSIIVNGSGDYWVKITEGKCDASDTAKVVFSTVPSVELGKDTSVCKGNSIVLRATSTGSNYLWQDGSTDSIYFVYTPGKYWVQVSNPCGVVADSIYVFFQNDYCDLFMANAFSPDNDLLNAEFKPVGKNITVKLFQIYNRWGELIFETDKDNTGWNGQYKGKPCEQDLYLWKLYYATPSGRYIKKSNASGTVMLLR